MRNVICLLMCLVLVVFLQIGVARNKETPGREPDYELVFENPQILSLDILMSAEAYKKMQPEDKDLSKAGNPERTSARSMFALEFKYVEANVSCSGKTYSKVGIRYRGNASMRMIPPDGKKPLKIDFDRFTPGQTFYGFRKLNFINCFRDPSMLRDKLTYDLMQKVGVPAPRAAFANLYLTVEGREREHLGLFVVVEQVDSVFLQNRFGNSRGLLIKGELTKDLEYRGADWEAYAHDHELESNPQDSNVSLLIQFLKFLTESSDKEVAAKIHQYLNVDRFLAWLAVNTLLTNLDSYAGLSHNWYLYYNTNTNRFEHIPWDVNEAFGNLQLGTPQQMIDFDVYRPYIGDRILIRRILAIEKYNTQYLNYVREFINGPFAQETVSLEIQRLHDFIKSAVEADSHEIYSFEDFEGSLDGTIEPKFPIFSSGIIGLKKFVTERVASVEAQLAGEKKGYRMEYAPGEASPQPSQLSAEEVKARRRTLKAKLEELEIAILARPADVELYIQKGSTIGELIEIGGPADAIKYLPQISEAFGKAVELEPENAGARLGRGTLRFYAPEMFGGDLEGSISDLEFVISKDPLSVQANLVLGLAYDRKGLADKAVPRFEKVLELDPQNQTARQQLEQLR